MSEIKCEIKNKLNIFLIIIICILVLAVAALGVLVYRQNNYFIQASASLSDNELQLADAESKIAEYSSKAEAQKAENDRLNSELDAATQERDSLKEENEELREQVEILKLKRRDELKIQIALNNVNQADAAEGGICYLTFDDGPSDNTLKILDILDSYGIKGTFFVLANAKTQYLPIIRDRGHAIGLHSASHNYSTIYASVNDYLADIKAVSDVVYNTTGIRSNIMRFPGGSSNNISRRYCPGIMTELTSLMPMLGYSYFDWNISSRDADASHVAESVIINSVLNGAKGKDSVCVLMHDTSAKDTTVAALPEIIEGLHNMGFRFLPITAETFGFHQPVIN